MPEHLRALIFVLVLASGVFWATRRAATTLIPSSTFVRWRNAYLALTLALFLAHNYWLYVLTAVVIGSIAARREAHVPGLFFLLILAAPPIQVEIPGFGLVNYLFIIDQYRLMTLVLLVPAALSLLQRATTLKFGRSPVDWMVMGYFLVICALNVRDATVTSWLRYVLSTTIDILVPYYVLSRSLRDMDGFKHALLGFVLGAMILSVIGAFEALRIWRLYEAVSWQLLARQPDSISGYLMRGGLLRPNASVGNSIVLGYVVMVGFGYFQFLRRSLPVQRQVWAGVLLLVSGVLLSLSRGPWVGLVFLVLVYVLQGPAPLKHLFNLGAAAVVVFGVLNVLPQGKAFLELLPFVGEEEAFNVEYRANLLTAAMPVIERNLWFGSTDYMRAPELQAMIQGQGIIDIVNSYIGVALDHGLLGLAFFLGIWITTLQALRGAIRQSLARLPDHAALGRSLFAVIASIMLVIYTVSGITAVPIVYWTALGVCVAYVAFVQRELSTQGSPREVSTS